MDILRSIEFKKFKEISFTVLIPHKESFKDISNNSEFSSCRNLEFKERQDDMSDFLKNFDFIFGAAGTSFWERSFYVFHHQ